MVTIRLTGQVTADGQLHFEPPSNLPPGAVQITIEIPDLAEAFTEAEINDLLTFTPKSGAEIVAAGLAGGWEDLGITDPVAWVEDKRPVPQQYWTEGLFS
jgi:hypothetical protein